VLFTLDSVGSGFLVFGTMTRCAVQGEILRRRANCKSTFDAVLTCVDDRIGFFWRGGQLLVASGQSGEAKYRSAQCTLQHGAHILVHAVRLCIGTTRRTHTHLFNGSFSGTIRVSRYQKSKTNLDFTEARDSEWQWHQLDHMQVCTRFRQTTTPTPPLLSFLQAGCPSCRPTNSVKALKAILHVEVNCKSNVRH